MKLTELLFGSPPQSLELKKEVYNSRITLPRAPMLDASYDSLGRYAGRSEIVYSCIEKKAQTACDPELIIQKRTSEGEWEKVNGHKALDTLNNPNPHDDGESFLRTWIASENIAGVFYAEIVRNGAGEPVNLYPLRPDWIFPDYIETAKGPVLYRYVYRTNGYEVYYKPEELLIHRLHGLGSLYAGRSPLSVALASIDADISATEYVRDFFNNDGTPSGILKITGRNLSDDEASRIKQKWQSLYARNGKGRGGVAVLDQSADYETVGARLTELDNDNLTSINETRICMAFGVPPVIIGAYVGLKNVNQKASFKGAMEEFWQNTMSPELKAIRKFLTRKYLTQFESEEDIKMGKIRFFWDMSTVAALQEDVDAIHDRVALGYKSGIYKLNEARAKVGLDAVEDEIGEQFYKAPVQGQIEDEEEPKSILDAVTLEKKTLDFRREPTEIETRVDIKAIADSYESGTEELTKVLQAIRKELIAQAGKAAAQLDDADLHTLALVPPKTADKRVRAVIEKAVADGRMQVATQKGMQTKGILEDIIQRLVDLTISRVVGEVATAVANLISALGVLGYDRDEIEDRMREELEARSDKPFELYARQAINTAVNTGRRQEMQDREDDIEYYVYSAILDKNVCGPCEDWDGAAADSLDQLPETPNIECEGGANCRCFIVSVMKSEV